MKYLVTVVFDASKTIEVEADSAEEAKDKAVETIDGVTLCHQCADCIEVGDPTGATEAVPA